MIGKKIRSLRKSKNMTIVELSEQINVTSGYISQIERDLISPSLTVLKRLSQVLEVPLSVLFLEESSNDVVAIPRDERPKVKLCDINVELEYITPVHNNDEKKLDFEAFIFKLNPKTWISNHSLSHNSIEYIYVIQGEIECHSGGKVYSVSKGDSLFIPENSDHLFYNGKGEVSEVLCIISPPLNKA
ncbi:MAG TPA: helix-turn-helix domain-containing protein [Sedimentibacter sp.]|jgi:transcriptional regulator with XRE-family HTH domain|nr:helix-turn-helix domain-containing protein [Sedimentibacter sp.]HOK49970.1 helix-turn-helix domain-containing protein [Sedimentibacter sp.]HOW23936.1 helix-turn-helix domain-containing protein [Sedimentibacter sp.]HRC81994.1 helix-turn-helix domain-containing protein [Sedimentibacter sp.]